MPGNVFLPASAAGLPKDSVVKIATWKSSTSLRVRGTSPPGPMPPPTWPASCSLRSADERSEERVRLRVG
jgi:hypothetical protein